MKFTLGQLVPVTLPGHTSAHRTSNWIQQSNLTQDGIIYRKYGQFQYKIFRNHNFLDTIWSLFDQKEQKMSSSFLIFNHNLLDVCFTPACPPLSPFSNTFSLLLFCFFLSVSRTSSVFKVQTTKADWGCYWSTNKERERKRQWVVPVGRVTQGQQKRCL